MKNAPAALPPRPPQFALLRVLALMMAGVLLFPQTAAAQSFAPGTLGYLYEDCRVAVKSQTASGFRNSYCFHFGMGYAFGGLSAQRALPKPAPQDPCREDKMEQYRQAASRFCPLVMEPPPHIVQNPVLATLHMLFAYAEELKNTNQLGAFHQPAPQALASMIVPGRFCDRAMAYKGKIFPYEISTEVEKFARNPMAIRKAVMDRTHENSATQCRSDVKAGRMFNRTICGAEILGYLSGIHAARAAVEDKISAANPACNGALNRGYNALDVGTYRCHSADMDTLSLGRAFVHDFDTYGAEPAARMRRTRFETVSTVLPRLRMCPRAENTAPPPASATQHVNRSHDDYDGLTPLP